VEKVREDILTFSLCYEYSNIRSVTHGSGRFLNSHVSNTNFKISRVLSIILLNPDFLVPENTMNISSAILWEIEHFAESVNL